MAGNTESAYHHYAPQTCDDTVPAEDGNDLVYSFTAPHDGRFRVTLNDEYNSEIYSATTCPPTPESCSDNWKNLSIYAKKTEIALAKDESIYIFVDGGGYFSLADSGAFTLVLEETEACADGVDNDGDALLDCDDPDCVNVELCAASAEDP